MKASEYAATWLTEHPRPSDATNRQCGYGIRQFLSSFGHRRLESITFAEARRWAEVHRSSAKYARAMYEDARRDGVVLDNPFAGHRLPQSNGRAHVRIITPRELVKLGNAAWEVATPTPDSHRLVAAIRFAAYTGLRRGEQLALEWEDLEGDEARISKSLRPDGVTTPTKTGRNRTVLIPAPAMHALVDAVQAAVWPAELDSNFRARATGRIFPYTVAEHRDRWDAARKAAGLDVAWHELRHFAATWMLEKLTGDDRYKLVARQLGHANARLVQELYTHPDEARERDLLRAALSQ